VVGDSREISTLDRGAGRHREDVVVHGPVPGEHHPPLAGGELHRLPMDEGRAGPTADRGKIEA
jgi:hypothetical protein